MNDAMDIPTDALAGDTRALGNRLLKNARHLGRWAIVARFESCMYLKIVHRKSVKKTAIGMSICKEV